MGESEFLFTEPGVVNQLVGTHSNLATTLASKADVLKEVPSLQPFIADPLKSDKTNLDVSLPFMLLASAPRRILGSALGLLHLTRYQQLGLSLLGVLPSVALLLHTLSAALGNALTAWTPAGRGV